MMHRRWFFVFIINQSINQIVNQSIKSPNTCIELNKSWTKKQLFESNREKTVTYPIVTAGVEQPDAV